jgi:hypothetical protein
MRELEVVRGGFFGRRAAQRVGLVERLLQTASSGEVAFVDSAPRTFGCC